MASIRTLAATQTLFIDFRHEGRRCREYTKLPDTPANRKKLAKMVKALDAALQDGTFDYATFFPDSKRVRSEAGAPTVIQTPEPQPTVVVVPAHPAGAGMLPAPQAVQGTPLFRDFTETWISESEVMWRSSYKRTVSDIVNKYFLGSRSRRNIGWLKAR